MSCRDFEILKRTPTSLEFQAHLLVVCAFASPARLVFCIYMSWFILSGLGFFTSEILQHRPQCNSSLWELWLPKFQPSLELPGRICEPDIHQGEDWAPSHWLASISLSLTLPLEPTLHFAFQGNRSQSLLRCSLIRMRGMEVERRKVLTSCICLLPPPTSSVQLGRPFNASWGRLALGNRAAGDLCKPPKEEVVEMNRPRGVPSEHQRNKIILTPKPNVTIGSFQPQQAKLRD